MDKPTIVVDNKLIPRRYVDRSFRPATGPKVDYAQLRRGLVWEEGQFPQVESVESFYDHLRNIVGYLEAGSAGKHHVRLPYSDAVSERFEPQLRASTAIHKEAMVEFAGERFPSWAHAALWAAELAMKSADEPFPELPKGLTVAEPPIELLPEPAAPPQVKANATRRARRGNEWWLDKLEEFQSQELDNPGLTVADFARSIGEKEDTTRKGLERARESKEQRTAKMKQLRDNR